MKVLVSLQIELELNPSDYPDNATVSEMIDIEIENFNNNPGDYVNMLMDNPPFELLIEPLKSI